MPETSPRSLSVLAPAKVNLYLHVTGRRGDGYHTLDSLVVFADTGDRVRLKTASHFAFSIDGPYARAFTAAEQDASEDSTNLVVKAVRGLARLVNRPLAVDIRLTKNLPLAAGIGGGSSDAAAAIWALLEWWDIAPQAVQGLDDLLLGLGADVPVCMACHAARVGGIGESVTPAEGLDELPALLVNPGKPCPTARIFKYYNKAFSDPAPAYAGGDLVAYLKEQHNDLTDAAISVAPEIADVLASIGEQKGCLLPRMSGSGGTCFGLFASELEALDAAEAILRAKPRWWVRATMLNRAQRY